jgi:hypothetical protein
MNLPPLPEKETIVPVSLSQVIAMFDGEVLESDVEYVERFRRSFQEFKDSLRPSKRRKKHVKKKICRKTPQTETFFVS